MILGTIASYNADQGVTLIIDGEESPTEKEYKFISSYQPQVDDRVLIEEVGESYVVLGALTATSITPPGSTYTLQSGNTANIVQLVDGSGSVVSTVTVDNVANATNSTNTTNAGKILSIESSQKPYSVQLKNASGSVLSTVAVSGVQSVFNHAYSTGTNLIKFRNGGSLSSPTLQYQVGTSAWKTLTNS